MTAPQLPPGAAAHEDLAPAAGWQARLLGALDRRKRLSVLVPVVVAVLGAPHACPFC